MSETQTKPQAQKPKTSKPAIKTIFAGVIIVFLIPAILWPVLMHIREYGRRTGCAEQLRQFGRLMLVYDGGDGEIRPTADKWCDLFVKYLEVRPDEFICKGSDAKIGESSYAVNKNIAGKTNSQISTDVVSLFETDFGKTTAGRQELLQNREWYKVLGPGSRYCPKWARKFRASDKVYNLRWNQVGGPEILTTEHHKGQGCNVLLHHGNVQFVKPEQFAKLKWKVEEKE